MSNAMKSEPMRRTTLTPDQLADAVRLKAIWDAAQDRPSQAEFGEKFEIGNQSAVGQFLNGRTPLSQKAAIGFAKGLRCSISDFSPGIAMDLAKGINAVTPRELEAAEAASAAPSTVTEALKVLAFALEDLTSQRARDSAVAMLTTFVGDPAGNMDMVPLIARRLSGEAMETKPSEWKPPPKRLPSGINLTSAPRHIHKKGEN